MILELRGMLLRPGVLRSMHWLVHDVCCNCYYSRKTVASCDLILEVRTSLPCSSRLVQGGRQVASVSSLDVDRIGRLYPSVASHIPNAAPILKPQ